MWVHFETFLEDISRCFLDRDQDLWLSRLVLPFSIVTKTGAVVLPTETEVAHNFEQYLAAMDISGLDLVDRNPRGLADCKDGTWLGTFQTRLVCRGQLITDPYTSTALLHLQEDRFRMSSVLNGRHHAEWSRVTGV